MDMQSFNKLCFSPDSRSENVENARRQLCYERCPGQETRLNAITFATRTGEGSDLWCALKDSVSSNLAGEVSCSAVVNKRDPVRGYAVVSLSSEEVLELVQFQTTQKEIHFYAQGSTLGHMVEIEVPKPKSWLKRILGGKRLWNVFLHDEMIGKIGLTYPVSKRSILSFELTNSITLPIGLGSVWFKTETNCVTPPDAPGFVSGDLEKLHFLLAVGFHTLILDVW